MKCIIQIDNNGNIVNHPVTLENFAMAFPDLDISGDTAPPGWAWFTRISMADATANVTITPMQTFKSRYSPNSDSTGFQDDHYVYDFTADEIRAMVDEIRANPPMGFRSWTLETTTYCWLPPIEKPTGDFRWDEDNMSWVEVVSTQTDVLPDVPGGIPLIGTPAKFSTVLTPRSALTPAPSSPT
jgi:hypothetical protein